MATYKRRREDESTFGFGRYPKRSRRDYTDNRAYHSESVNRLYRDRHDSKLNGINSCDQKLYHFSLSSELFGRNSNSHSQRYSTCSNGYRSNSRYEKRQRGYQNIDEADLKRKKRPDDVSKKEHTHSRVCIERFVACNVKITFVWQMSGKSPYIIVCISRSYGKRKYTFRVFNGLLQTKYFCVCFHHL